MSDTDKKEIARLKAAEYERLPHRKEKCRMYAIQINKTKKLLSTAKRLEEHTFEELLTIAAMKCQELNIDFTTRENEILSVLSILHGSAFVHKNSGSK